MLSLLPGMVGNTELAVSWVDLLQAVAQRASQHTTVALLQLIAAHPAVHTLVGSVAATDDASPFGALVYVLAMLAGQASLAPPALKQLIQRYVVGDHTLLCVSMHQPGCLLVPLRQHGRLGSCDMWSPAPM